MSLLADCFTEGGLTDLARGELKELEGGREADQQWKGLQFKFGLLYEGLGRAAEAKAIFAEIYATDSEFEDVESRVWGGG